MTLRTRRSARNQAIPPEEGAILRGLRGYSLYSRTKQLYDAGWTLSAIGAVFDPPKARTTIKNWVDGASDSVNGLDLPPVTPPVLLTPEVYVPKRPKSPGIAPADLAEIQTLAPIARKYRASMNPAHAAARANENLTNLCKRLRALDVTVQELADAAGVTYRAMARRLGN